MVYSDTELMAGWLHELQITAQCASNTSEDDLTCGHQNDMISLVDTIDSQPQTQMHALQSHHTIC